jgi:hypothetical protein
MSIYYPQVESPLKSDKCAVVIPLYKSIYSENETICVNSALTKFGHWDIFFATHVENTNQPFLIDGKSVRYSFFKKERFKSINSYSEWLLTFELYSKFINYKKILICQTDAYIVSDEINYWVDKDYDYIGAPWHGLVSITPNYQATPNFNGKEFKLFVGNGGFCMRDTSGCVNTLLRNSDIVNEFHGNEDGLFAFLGIVDPLFKMAPYHDACLFALELLAADTINKTKKMPMGFHALEKNDFSFWRDIIRQLNH